MFQTSVIQRKNGHQIKLMLLKVYQKKPKLDKIKIINTKHMCLSKYIPNSQIQVPLKYDTT